MKRISTIEEQTKKLSIDKISKENEMEKMFRRINILEEGAKDTEEKLLRYTEFAKKIANVYNTNLPQNQKGKIPSAEDLFKSQWDLIKPRIDSEFIQLEKKIQDQDIEKLNNKFKKIEELIEQIN